MKIPVGILGATGMVGQRYISLLENHPWFEVVYLAASARSAGKRYMDTIDGRWHMESDVPSGICNQIVYNALDSDSAIGKCRFVFSAFELSDKELIKKTEMEYADNNIPVVSNASACRWVEDVPLLIPEINPNHLDIIKDQKINNNWKNGFIVAKPNCSIQSYMVPIHALRDSGYNISDICVTTMQAVSGAGYPGCSSLDMIGNVVPYISGEEEKTEKEPLKIFGFIKNKKINNFNGVSITASCNRVPVIDGHVACVNIKFDGKRPSGDEIINIWNNFSGEPQRLNLPSAPVKPIVYTKDSDRPQPRKDLEKDKGMATVIGRLRECNVFDFKFVGLSHNTIRGAAGGGILNAELLCEKGYFNF